MIEIPQGPKFENPLAEERLREPLSSLSVELSRISAEIQSINSGFQSQLHQAILDTQTSMHAQFEARLQGEFAAARERLEAEIRASIRKEFEGAVEAQEKKWSDVQREIERTNVQMEAVASEILLMLDDPEIELSRVMRKKSEQAELKAYMQGLQYLIAKPDINSEGVRVEQFLESPIGLPAESTRQSRLAVKS